LIYVFFRQQHNDVTHDISRGLTDDVSDSAVQTESSLTDEQKAALFGSTTATGRPMTPTPKRRAVSLAHIFVSLPLISFFLCRHCFISIV